jgi:hypothetical protein
MTTPASGEGIEVIGRHNPLQWLLYFTQLTVEVDGEPQRGPWRRQRFIAAPAGQHRVNAFFRYLTMARACEAVLDIQVSPGQVARLEYRAPIFVTSKGKLRVVT